MLAAFHYARLARERGLDRPFALAAGVVAWLDVAGTVALLAWSAFA